MVCVRLLNVHDSAVPFSKRLSSREPAAVGSPYFQGVKNLMKTFLFLVALAAGVGGVGGVEPRATPAATASGCTRRFVLGGALAIGMVGQQRAAFAATNPREKLLAAITSDAPEAMVMSAIEELVPLDPSNGLAAKSKALDGTWRLLWSAGADKFRTLLGLPRGIRPESMQLLGTSATEAVGTDRVANLLALPGITARLSSGVRVADDNDALLVILPPFRFEVLLPGGAQKTLFEAGSDADFRKLNARDADAQAAGRNLYLQRYLDTSGKPGDLRVSTIVAGDPVIVGSVFVHERVA